MTEEPLVESEQPAEERPAGEESFVALFERLVDDSEQFVLAELQLYRARLFERLKEGLIAIAMIAIAFFLAQSALVALLVGLVATLREPLGPAGATATVVLVALAIAGLLLWLGLQLLRKATEVRKNRQP